MNKKQLEYITGVWREKAKEYSEVADAAKDMYRKGWCRGQAALCSQHIRELEEGFEDE